jgi:DNA-binding SARP family transcriptional activator/tetratricopeptide (TPR) repeat protein
MEIRLLGLVEIWSAGVRISAGPPQQRMMLAALAVDVPRPVPAGVLIDRIWGEQPPKKAEQAVWTRISGLRALLAGADAPGAAAAAGGPQAWVPREADGYRLRVDADAVDLLRFRQLSGQARDPARSDAQRVVLLAQALGLWRGQPLAGLGGQWAEQSRHAWQAERVEATVAWAQAALRTGQHAEVIPAARHLTEQHPLSEPLAAVLIRALAADGRTSEAAEYCRTTCERIVAELGVEPGPELQDLQQAILGGRPVPPLPPAPRPAAAPVATPAQLPADVPGFAGRTEQLTRLDMLLTQDAGHAPTTVVISAVSGTAGVGKTALAVHWAHQITGRFPDGQLYVNLRGYDPGGQVIDPTAAVRAFLDALGVPAERIPLGLDAQAALYRSVLAGKRVLVLIDNARDAQHARPLLPGTRTALAVVTSRNSLASLVATDGAHPLTLDLLSTTDARDLLERRLTLGRVAAEPAAVNQIITACARLPLALALVAARAATHPTFPLAALAAELSAARGQAGQLDTGDVLGQVQAVFSWSYTTLTPPAARLFRLLGLHPGPDTTPPAAASLTGLPPAQTRPLLTELTRAGLLGEPAPGRYGFHDLLRAYATHLTHTTDTDQEQEEATRRLLDHYTHTAHTAARLLHPARDPIQIPLTPPTPGTNPEPLADQHAANRWLDAERPVLLASQQLAADAGRDTHAWQLAWTLNTMLRRRGRWNDLASAWQAALPAGRLPHPAAAYAHRLLGWAVTKLGDDQQAHTHLHHAMQLYADADDPIGQAHTHHELALLWERRNRPDRALDHAQQALALYQATGHRRGQAHALNSVGWYHALLGDHAHALTNCQNALTLNQQLGDRNGQAATWDSLGYAHHHLGHHTHAANCYQHALTLYRDLDDRYGEATALTHLGDTHHAADDPTAARTAWTAALDIFTNLDHPDTDELRTKIHDLNQRTPNT